MCFVLLQVFLCNGCTLDSSSSHCLQMFVLCYQKSAAEHLDPKVRFRVSLVRCQGTEQGLCHSHSLEFIKSYSNSVVKNLFQNTKSINTNKLKFV